MSRIREASYTIRWPISHVIGKAVGEKLKFKLYAPVWVIGVQFSACREALFGPGTEWRAGDMRRPMPGRLPDRS